MTKGVVTGSGGKHRRVTRGKGDEENQGDGVEADAELEVTPLAINDRPLSVFAWGSAEPSAGVNCAHPRRWLAFARTALRPSRTATLAVERTGRLVGEQQVGMVGHRTGDRHPLLLAA
mgnify:CR=1 FL=1